MEPLLGEDGCFAHMADWGAKQVGQMLRIAGIIAVCEGERIIEAETINRATTIAIGMPPMPVFYFPKQRHENLMRSIY